MRSYRLFFLVAALLLCLHSVVAAPHTAVRRQDDRPNQPLTTPSIARDASSRASASATPLGEEASTQRTESDRAPPSKTTTTPKPTASVAESALPQVPETSISTAPEATSSPETHPENPLPIQPTLTPAMGLTGAILLITGLTYAIIGIKNKWIYIFGSAAYLTALSVTVLIVYLMSPPVSNATQGGFFVAAFFTGAIFGGLALVFSDITEGFGCLLGGFCLSMWFLSLKEGGLITSLSGRAIFIGCFSGGAFCLSFSRHTRNYGLIGSIAFSGATATILGIDCLSSAGWKEFWLYLWALNDNVFPLDTNTYPLTKNIKAELAGVVIITVFGIVSQMRVWKMVKEHREQSAAHELEKQQDKDREDEQRGREIEDNFQRERAQWEAAYGNKDTQDSPSEADTLKKSLSVREKEVSSTDSLDLVDVEKGGIKKFANADAQAGTTVTVSVLQEDDIQEIDTHGNPIARSSSETAGKVLPEATEIAVNVTTKRSSVRTSIPPPPPIVPLPFKVPQESGTSSENGDNASVSAVPETEGSSPVTRRPMSKRISDMSNLRQTSVARISQCQDDFAGVPHIEDDRASSIAATLDNDNDDLSVRQLSRPQSPIGTENESVQSPTTEKPEEVANKENSEDATIKSQPSARQSLTTSTDPKPNEVGKRMSLRSARLRKDTPISSEKGGSEVRTEPELSEGSSLKDIVLPERLSKVALSYRTNEWAKHLEAAERPEPEDLSEPNSPGVTISHNDTEQPAPVSDEIAYPLIGSKRDSRRVSMNRRSTTSHGEGPHRSASQQSTQRGPSASRPTSILSKQGLARSSSATQLDQLAPLPSNTLMGQREKLIRNRISSQSFIPPTSAAATTLLDQQDNMTLAQRRQLLQQGGGNSSSNNSSSMTPTVQIPVPAAQTTKRAPPSASQKWHKKSWAAPTPAPGFNSHQPSRTPSQSDAKREELYANWRSSLQQDSIAGVSGPAPATPAAAPPVAAASGTWIAEQQRATLLAERQVREEEKRRRESVQAQRREVMDSAMRSGAMLGAHREAMRRLQMQASGDNGRG